MSLFLPADEEDNIYRRANIPESVEEIGDFAFGWFGYNWDIYIHSTKIKNFSSGVVTESRKFGNVHILYGTKSSFIENNPYVEGGFNIIDDIDNIDVTTGIKMPTFEGNDDSETVVYDLQGRHVQKPTKGFCIVNGKKVFIKK